MIVLMEQILIYVALIIVGLCMGSFAGATVWRLRAHQLIGDKKAGEKVSAKEYELLKPLTEKSLKSDRSRCLKCSHVLAWYDLMPLVSWLGLRGKCRYCHKSIGRMEPLIELGTAAFFVLSFMLWPDPLVSALEITTFVLWLIAGVMLAILFVYDLKWFLLPNYVVFPLIAVGVLITLISIFSSTDVVMALVGVTSAVVLLSGIYLFLWFVSKGRWIGFGDIKLGLALALILVDWQLAFIALFAANLIGCLVVIPGLMTHKLTRKTHVPFGPLLILGAIVAMLAGDSIITWYFATLL